MMSELAHRDTDIETQNTAKTDFANVIPLQRVPGESIHYAELSETEVASMFMSTLRHAGRVDAEKDDLAKIIEDYLGARTDLDSETINARLSQIVLDSKPSDEQYDERLEKDPIFAHLIGKLINQEKNHNSREQRQAARKLIDLRIALPDFETPDDSTWREVSNRLMD